MRKIVEMESGIKIALAGITIVVFLVILLCKGCTTDMSATSTDEQNVYNCNVKHLKLSTTIEIEKDGEKWGKVKGEVWRFVEDPLTLYDADDNKIGYAGDTYHFFAQDSHGLYFNDEFKYDMVGKVDLWGETYELYDVEEKMVAKATFDATSTEGKLVDMDDNVIATYESGFLSSDFNVRIEKDSSIEDEVIIMLFASYYSDASYDSSTTSSSSSSSSN